MGFLSNIFKKKKGGTFVGNLLRGGASAFTGGLLGSGAGLQKWEAEQAQKEQEQMFQQLAQQNQGYNVGQNLVKGVAVPAMANGGGNQPNVGESVFMETMKKRWYIPAGVIAFVGGLAYWVGNRGKKKKGKF